VRTQTGPALRRLSPGPPPACQEPKGRLRHRPGRVR
jgi:hypothetical protein